MSLTIVEKNGRAHVKGTVAGQRVRRSLGLPSVGFRKEANELKAAIERQVIERAMGGKKVGEIAEEYLKWKTMEGKDMAQPDYRYRVPFIVEALGGRYVEEVDVSRFVRETLGGLAAGSVKKTLNVLKAVMRFGVEHGMCARVPKFPTVKVDDARDQHFNLEEVEEFLGLVRARFPEEELMAAVLVDAGLRLGEALTLRGSDFVDGCVMVKKKSGGKTRTRKVPMSKRLKEAVERLVVRSGGLFEGWGSANQAAKRMGRVMKVCCEVMGVERLRVHDLRHTFAYQCGAHGVDLAELQYLMGHSSITMTVRYRGFIRSRADSVIERFGM